MLRLSFGEKLHGLQSLHGFIWLFAVGSKIGVIQVASLPIVPIEPSDPSAIAQMEGRLQQNPEDAQAAALLGRGLLNPKEEFADHGSIKFRTIVAVAVLSHSLTSSVEPNRPRRIMNLPQVSQAARLRPQSGTAAQARDRLRASLRSTFLAAGLC